MPADSLALAVTTGVGFSVVAGIISGVFYILSQGFAKKRPRKSTATANPQAPPWRCTVCSSPFLNAEGVLDVDRAVVCRRCGQRVCRTRCATRESRVESRGESRGSSSRGSGYRDVDEDSSVCSSGGGSGSGRGGGCGGGRKWLCETCRQPEGWLRGMLRSVKLAKGDGEGGNSNRDCFSRNDMEDPSLTEKIYENILENQKLEREQIRDFMERLIGAMLNGDLDNVSIKRLYNDKKYDVIFNKYHRDLSSALTELGSALHISMANLPVSGSSPCTAHAALKQLVQQFISDAAVLPLLRKAAEKQLSAGIDDVSNRTYEDLLSSAIINKVIQNNQHEKARSRVSSASSSRASSSCRNRKRDPLDFDNWPEDDASSVSSSIDEIMHRSASSAGSTKYVDIETLTIRESPGVSLAVHPSKSSSSSLNHLSLGLEDDGLEDNWYMQKPGKTTTASLVSVPILVPNPNGEAEVLIDGKPVDASSDLSDLDSDEDDDALDTASSLGTILVDAKGIIGGKNVLVEINHEDCDEFGEEIDRGTKPGSNTVLVDNKLIIGVNMYTEKTDNDSGHEVIEATNGLLVEGTYDSSLLSLDSNTEQDTEYTERYASLPRTIEKRSFRRKETDFNDLENLDSGVTSDVEDPGKDNMDIKEQNNDHSILFGRDYYIKQASRSSGLRSKNMFEESEESLILPNTNGYVLTADLPSPTNESTTFAEDLNPEVEQSSTEIDEDIISIEITDTSGVFTALPVAVQQSDDVDSSMDTSSPVQQLRPNGLDLSSDSDYSMERTYNVSTGEVSRKDAAADVVEDAKSPVGIKYVQSSFDEADSAPLNEFLKKRSAIKTLISDEVASSPEQIKEIKEMLEQEESSVPYEENNNNIEAANNKKNVDDMKPIEANPAPISNDEVDKQEFSLEYSISGQGDSVVDQPEMPDEALQQPSCPAKSKQEPSADFAPPEVARIEPNVHAGDTNGEMGELGEIAIPSVKNLRKLFDMQKAVDRNTTVSKRFSTEIKIEPRKEPEVFEEPEKDIIIIENGKPEEEVSEKEKPIFQSVKNLRKFFDKDNQQNLVNNSITARSISKQVKNQLKEDSTQY